VRSQAFSLSHFDPALEMDSTIRFGSTGPRAPSANASTTAPAAPAGPTLIVTYCSSDNPHARGEQYAVIPFPQRYEVSTPGVGMRIVSFPNHRMQ
jgi:hypothetical protein